MVIDFLTPATLHLEGSGSTLLLSILYVSTLSQHAKLVPLGVGQQSPARWTHPLFALHALLLASCLVGGCGCIGGGCIGGGCGGGWDGGF